MSITTNSSDPNELLLEKTETKRVKTLSLEFYLIWEVVYSRDDGCSHFISEF